MTFDELLKIEHQEPVVALFYGASCAPCEQLKPKLNRVCETHGLRLEQFNSAAEMPAVRRLGLRSVPAVLVVRHLQPPQLAFMGNLMDADIVLRLKAAGVELP